MGHNQVQSFIVEAERANESNQRWSCYALEEMDKRQQQQQQEQQREHQQQQEQQREQQEEQQDKGEAGAGVV